MLSFTLGQFASLYLGVHFSLSSIDLFGLHNGNLGLGKLTVSGTENANDTVNYLLSIQETKVKLDISKVSIFHPTDIGILEVFVESPFLQCELKPLQEDSEHDNNPKKLEVRAKEILLKETSLNLRGIVVDFLILEESGNYKKISSLSIPSIDLESDFKKGASIKEIITDYVKRATAALKELMIRKGFLKKQD